MLRREGELEAPGRSSGEPSFGFSGDVRRVVVENQLDRSVDRIGGIKKLEEFNELSAAVAVSDEGMDLAGEQINPGQQAQRALPFVLMITHKGRVDAGLGWQIGRGRCDGLDSRFFIVGDDRHRLARFFRLVSLFQQLDLAINAQNLRHLLLELGMRTTATMMFGVGESFEQRINHFEQVRRLQEETGGFTAFIPWSFQPTNTALGGRKWDEATSVEYLKVLAISRLYLDNVENVQSSWVTQGLKVLQLGLRFGGNDVGSVMLEENVVKAAGTSNCTTEEELRQVIRGAGFRPVQRDTLYTTYFLN